MMGSWVHSGGGPVPPGLAVSPGDLDRMLGSVRTQSASVGFMTAGAQKE